MSLAKSLTRSDESVLSSVLSSVLTCKRPLALYLEFALTSVHTKFVIEIFYVPECVSTGYVTHAVGGTNAC